MALTFQECAHAIERMTPEEEHRFLINVGHLLTVAARGAYQEAGPGAHRPVHLQWFNEIQHRIYGQIQGHMAMKTGLGRLDANALAIWLTGNEREDETFHSSCRWAVEAALLSIGSR